MKTTLTYAIIMVTTFLSANDLTVDGNLNVNGNLGIGVDNPQTKLEIFDNDRYWQFNRDSLMHWVSDKSRGFILSMEDGSSPIDPVSIRFGYDPSSGEVRNLVTLQAQRSTGADPSVLFQGKIGIETLAPEGKFHAVTHSETYPFIFENTGGAGVGSLIVKLKNQLAGYSYFQHSANHQDIPYNWFSGLTADMDAWSVARDNRNNPFVIIRNNGNVGLGTITPTEKLDVEGNAKISGSFEAASGKVKIYDNGDIVINEGVVDKEIKILADGTFTIPVQGDIPMFAEN